MDSICEKPLEKTVDDTHSPVALILLIVRRVGHDNTALEINLVNGDDEPPVPAIYLPSQVQGNDDGRSKVLLKEVLGIRRGIRRRL